MIAATVSRQLTWITDFPRFDLPIYSQLGQGDDRDQLIPNGEGETEIKLGLSCRWINALTLICEELLQL